MASTVVPIVLAGGQGSRLWPMSRAARPKQFLPLQGQESLYQKTLRRVGGERYAAPLIITNSDYRFLVAEQAAELQLPLSGVLLEPSARNTAPAIAAAALYAAKAHGADAVLHVIPSDHAIDTDEEYWTSLDTAITEAETGRLVTFGISPTRPETGFGYIEAGNERAAGVHDVVRFTEKPDASTAERMIATGKFFWNSGMFVFRADVLLSEFAALAPDVLQAARAAVEAAVTDLDFVRLDVAAFDASPSISFDYAICEKSSRISIVPVGFPWSDLGSWDSVWKSSDKDADGNSVLGDVTLSSTRNSLVISEQAHVVVEGLSDVAVISTDDAVLVMPLSRAQNVGKIVTQLKQSDRTSHLTEIHRTAYRPWGGYSSILKGNRFQVKRLFVKPGKKLSLQKHFHRAEHWIVVSGIAEVTIDGRVTMLSENESVYLPLGCVHRLANPGKILLELIEVQTGAYLGEDDIVRIEDEFGRT